LAPGRPPIHTVRLADLVGMLAEADHLLPGKTPARWRAGAFDEIGDARRL